MVLNCCMLALCFVSLIPMSLLSLLAVSKCNWLMVVILITKSVMIGLRNVDVFAISFAILLTCMKLKVIFVYE